MTYHSKIITLGLILLCCFACSKTETWIWSEDELSILRSLSLSSLPPLPDSPTNRYANDPQAQALGKKLFFDKRLSINGKLSCASCHQPEKYFTDGHARGIGIQETGRNTPTIVGSAWLRWFYWDGRRDSLWSQALIPFEAPSEMGSSRLEVVKFITQEKSYRQFYEALFSSLPSIDWSQLPEQAGPLGNKQSQDNWYRLERKLQLQINRIFANIGKAIAAYERTLKPRPSRFDKYVEQLLQGDRGEHITTDELAGLRLFIDANKTQCLQCHNGPLFKNNGFHNIGSGNFVGEYLDFGRMLGLQAVLLDEFNCLGDYSDADPSACSALRFLNKTNHIPLQGAFKTPSLRNLSETAPYFHDGRFTTLLDVMEYYNTPPKDNGPHELKPLNLSEPELKQLVAFMKMLTEITP